MLKFGSEGPLSLAIQSKFNLRNNRFQQGRARKKPAFDSNEICRTKLCELQRKERTSIGEMIEGPGRNEAYRKPDLVNWVKP
jgi:hypothetical protein